METFSTTNFIVHYHQSEQSYIEELINTLQNELDKLLLFFELEKLQNPTDIYIYNDKNKFVDHMLKYTDTYQDWMIGNTSDGNINMLSLDICRATQEHRRMTLPEWTQVVTHELVHICQQEINPNAYGCEWFWEALALNLSGQVLPETAIDCTKEELMLEYLNLSNGYQISYTIGKYLLETYPHGQIIKYVKYPQRLWDDTQAIINEVNNKMSAV